MRQVHFEAAAGTQPRAVRADAAAVQFHQALRQRQADAQAALGALQRRLLLREHREHVLQRLRAHADAGVRDAEHDLVAGAGHLHRHAATRAAAARAR
jgi:hypothetical protein